MRCGAIVLVFIVGLAGHAEAEPCAGNQNALGTSRTMTVDPATHPLIGRIQYPGTLPLNDREVVITLDDGPIPPYTDRILDILAHECVKVTFFMVGQMALAYPDLVRRVYDAGHTIGSHSQTHPFGMDQMDFSLAQREVDSGFAAVRTALGNPRAVAPFFRVPGLARTSRLEYYLASQSISVWSADADGADWTGIGSAEVVRRAMSRIEARRGGVLLLHDIQPATVLALPALLKELKDRGYRIVHAIAPGERPRLPDLSAPAVASKAWPRVMAVYGGPHPPKAEASSSPPPQKLASRVLRPKKKEKERPAEWTLLGWLFAQRQ
jgi:peptidoglycan/xylan/chitin deacetylase (PgdA/CDA1 family)